MTATSYLAQLRAAHRELLDCVAEMERVTSEISGPLEYAPARFRISRASLARRTLWHRIFKDLSDRTDPHDAETLRVLNHADMRLLRQSSDHIGRWSAETVLLDWRGYCEASRHIRRAMRDAIALEQRLLYPILERYERRPGRLAA